MPERSARTSFRCIERRRLHPRRHRRLRCYSSFCHYGPAGYDGRARLVSRSCRSLRPTQLAHRRPRRRTYHDGPPLRLLCESLSASPTSVDLLLFPNSHCLAARRRTQRYRRPSSTPIGPECLTVEHSATTHSQVAARRTQRQGHQTLSRASRVAPPSPCRGGHDHDPAESATVRQTSMIGLAASPGTEVDPMRSTAMARSARTPTIALRSCSKQIGHSGS